MKVRDHPLPQLPSPSLRILPSGQPCDARLRLLFWEPLFSPQSTLCSSTSHVDGSSGGASSGLSRRWKVSRGLGATSALAVGLGSPSCSGGARGFPPRNLR